MRNGETHLRLQNASWIGQRFKSGDATGPLVLFIGFPGAILAPFGGLAYGSPDLESRRFSLLNKLRRHRKSALGQ